jgi:ubiquinone/menaquinone biosynthesis C-methylase UbiE
MTKDLNQTTYTAPHIVNYYAQLNQLQPAEQAVFNLLEQQGLKLKMLDIGVGGGRTTQHFSKITSEYIGTDYSAEMISACKKRFSTSPHKIHFEVCDARDMSQFADNSFNFILFSFNGIDYVSHLDRLKIFQEISRVGKPGSYFLFSSHNLQGIESEFEIKNHISLNPLKTYVNLVMFALLRFFNRPYTSTQLGASDFAIIRDESHNFQLRTYYIRPKQQIHQLDEWFSHLKIYSWRKEMEITNIEELKTNCDKWLYYLCKINE